jgi:hypothetical protein
MKRPIPLALVLGLVLVLPGCSDMQLEESAAKHRAYVCSHQQSVMVAANLTILGAEKIKDVNLREASIALARAELAIVAGC